MAFFLHIFNHSIVSSKFFSVFHKFFGGVPDFFGLALMRKVDFLQCHEKHQTGFEFNLSYSSEATIAPIS